MKFKTIITIGIITFLGLGIAISASAFVVKRGDRVYIEDRTGKRWDFTEAQKRGFKPDNFNFGLGKDAFTPLQDEDLSTEQFPSSSRHKIIGVAADGESHAYSIDRLVHHEIANTTIAGSPIAVGY